MLLDGSFWAGSRLSASVRGSMISCRLGRSERLAVVANKGAFQLSAANLYFLPYVQKDMR